MKEFVIGLIESAVNRAFGTFDGQDLYKDIEEKISVITYSLIKNQGFIDGNKRSGVATMILLLKINNINIEYTQQELVDLGLNIADGTYNEKYIFKWIREHRV